MPEPGDLATFLQRLLPLVVLWPMLVSAAAMRSRGRPRYRLPLALAAAIGLAGSIALAAGFVGCWATGALPHDTGWDTAWLHLPVAPAAGAISNAQMRAALRLGRRAP